MTHTSYVIDATTSHANDGLFCICPVTMGDNHKPMEVVTGLSLLSSVPPHRGSLVGVYHEDGPKEADRWLRKNLVAVSDFVSDGATRAVGSDDPHCLMGAALKILSENHPDDLKPIYGISELKEALRSSYDLILP